MFQVKSSEQCRSDVRRRFWLVGVRVASLAGVVHVLDDPDQAAGGDAQALRVDAQRIAVRPVADGA